MSAASVPSVLIRMDNLRTGGGLQVAQSFLTELAKIIGSDAVTAYPWLGAGTRVLVSEEVAKSCSRSALESVRPEIAAKPSRLRTVTDTKQADVVFTLFGPTYDRVRARRSIVGFADVTSLYPELAKSLTSTPGQKAKLRIRSAVSRAYYRRADKVIVEARHLAEDLATSWGIDPGRISIVPNVVNRVFADAEVVKFSDPGTPPTFCYVTRAYPHKNLTVLGPTARALKSDFGTDVRFLLTLTDAEWAGIDAEVRDHSVNLGPVAVADLPGIYGQSDGCVFPSLLEGFSATPLEALATGTPLIASDRRFCTDVVGDCALYADPNDPGAWARAIHSVLSDRTATADRMSRGRALIEGWPSAHDRAVAYLGQIDAELRDLRGAATTERPVAR